MDSEELFVNVTPETFFSANSFLASRAVSVAVLLVLALRSMALNSSAEIFLSLELTVSCIRWELRMFSSLLDLLAVSNFWITSEALREVSSIPLTSAVVVVVAVAAVADVAAKLLQFDICIIEEPWVTQLESAGPDTDKTAEDDAEDVLSDAEDEDTPEEADLIAVTASVSCLREEEPFVTGLGATGG